MRVTDIWRAYYDKWLLEEIDGYLAFFGPNAYQDRNSHSYLADFIDETILELTVDLVGQKILEPIDAVVHGGLAHWSLQLGLRHTCTEGCKQAMCTGRHRTGRGDDEWRETIFLHSCRINAQEHTKTVIIDNLETYDILAISRMKDTKTIAFPVPVSGLSVLWCCAAEFDSRGVVISTQSTRCTKCYKIDTCNYIEHCINTTMHHYLHIASISFFWILLRKKRGKLRTICKIK